MNMAGIKCGGFRKRCIISARGVDRAKTADKFHAHTLLHLFNLAQQYAANLARGAHVSATAGGEIKVSDIDQPQIPSLLGWELAQAELARVLQRHKANAGGP